MNSVKLCAILLILVYWPNISIGNWPYLWVIYEWQPKWMMSPFYEMAFMECCFLEILDIAVTTIKQTHFDRNKSQVIKIPTKHWTYYNWVCRFLASRTRFVGAKRLIRPKKSVINYLFCEFVFILQKINKLMKGRTDENKNTTSEVLFFARNLKRATHFRQEDFYQKSTFKI